MTAALRAEERAAPYLVAPLLTDQLDTFASAPEGFKRLRELVLSLAVRGMLVPQDPKDEPADELLKRIAAEKRKLLATNSIRPEKALNEIDDAESPFDIPGNWRLVRLQELAWPQAGFAFKANLFNEVGDGLPLIRIRDVGADGPSTYYSGEYRDEFVVESGDWLVSMDGQFRVAKWHGPRALLNQRVSRLVFFGGETQQRLICIALQHELLKLQGQKAYTTVDHLSGGQIASRLIPLPPLAEQSRIVAKVEELMALIAALEAKVGASGTAHSRLLDTLLAALADSPDATATADAWAQLAPHFDLLLQTPADVDRLQQTLLQLAVKGRLVPQDPKDEPAAELLKRIRAEKERLVAEGKIKREKPLPSIIDNELPFDVPGGWQWAKLGDVVISSEAGWSPSCESTPRESGKWGVLKVSAVSWGKFLDDENKALPSHLKARPECEVQPGDFLLSRANTAELVARSVVAWNPDPQLMLSDKIIRLHIAARADKAYINLFNNSSFARAHYVAKASGTSASMKNVSREVVLSLPIPVPPAAEQSRIAAAVASLTALCGRLRERLATRRALSAKLATALTESALQ